MASEPADSTDKSSTYKTIASLRLNLDEAMKGRTWLLLPEGFRDQESGKTYPLPYKIEELQKLVTIPLIPNKRDCGSLYLKRCMRAYRTRMAGKQARAMGVAYAETRIEQAQQNLRRQIKAMKAEAAEAVEGVKKEAEKAIASMHDLFALGREGIEGQMRAHLDNVEWQGESIDAKAFRECFRMVTQTVKGLGLPSDEREKAREAVMEELAKSLRETQEAVALAPGKDEDETEH